MTRKNKMKFFLTIFTFVACGPKPTELSNAAETVVLPTAQSLFERSLEVAGTKEGLSDIENFNSRSVMRIPAAGIEGDRLIQYQSPNLIRVSQNVPGIGSGTVGYNGTTAWSSDNMVGPRIIEGRELDEFLMDSEIDSDLKFAHWYPEMRTVGLVDFKGKPSYQVEATSRFGRTDTKYFDPETGWLTGESYEVQSPLGPMTMVLAYQNIKEMAGILMPSLTIIETGPITLEIEVLSAEKNKTLAEGLFDLPPEIEELLAEDAEGEGEPPAAPEPPAAE
jgi:hypothetical protein